MFKVGDKVITTKDTDYAGCKVFPIGTVGVIKNIHENLSLPYEVYSDGEYWHYSEDMLEKYDANTELCKAFERASVAVKFSVGGKALGECSEALKSFTETFTEREVKPMRSVNDIMRDFKICQQNSDCDGCSYFNGDHCTDFKNELNEEVLQAAEALQKALEDALTEPSESFRAGMEFTYDAVKKMSTKSILENDEIFGTAFYKQIFHENTVHEFVQKIEAFEHEHDKNMIRFGDVVRCDDIFGLVTHADGEFIHVLFNDGSAGLHHAVDFEKSGSMIDFDMVHSLEDILTQLGLIRDYYIGMHKESED